MKKQMHRLLSLMLSLILVVGLIPGTMTAYAVTSGSGTESDPLYVTTFAELKEALEKEGDTYIVVNSFETSNTDGNGIKFYSLDYGYEYMNSGDPAIYIPAGRTKTLVVNTTIDCRPGNMEHHLGSFISNAGNLTIMGNGIINCGFNASKRDFEHLTKNSVIYNTGTLTVKENPTITTKDSKVTCSRHAIWNDGTATIEGGTFVGYCDIPEETQGSQVIDDSYAVLNNGTMTIKNGTFNAFTTRQGKTAYGLYSVDTRTSILGGAIKGIWSNTTMNSEEDDAPISTFLASGYEYRKVTDDTVFDGSSVTETGESLYVASKKYTITVTGNGNPKAYYLGEEINKQNVGDAVVLSADATYEGQEFDKWISEDVVITNADKYDGAYFTMPSKDVTVTATYKNASETQYSITVKGEGNPKAFFSGAEITSQAPGKAVALSADATYGEQVFDKWVSEDVEITNADKYDGAYFTMPSKNVTVTATYKNVSTKIELANTQVTVPVAGENPNFTATPSDSDKYTTVVGVWYDRTAGKTLTDSDTFTAGHKYDLRVVFTANTGYTFDSNTVFTINGNSTNSYSTAYGYREISFEVPEEGGDTPPTEYDITVTGGTASANKAVAGTVITLTVDESAIPAGKVFDKWEVVSGGVTVTDGKFTMPTNAVEIKATYKDAPVIPTEYDITVTGGTASANKAVAGTVITLTVDESAIPAGKVFDKWEVVSGGVTVTDGKFTMPTNAVEIKATYKDAPVIPTEYDITVTGGTASANKAVAGTVITLTVDESAIPAGKVFDKWEVVSGGVTVTDGKFTMPTNAVEIKATYKDAPVSHTCDIKPVAKDEPSCTEGGKEAYYKCEGCGKFYEDALGAKEITDLANWGNLPKLGHTESDWKSDKDNHWKECTVTACGVIIEDSKAAHKDDNKDGKCDVCEYNVGLPTTPDDDKPNDNPQTGDNSNMFLWIALLFISGAGVVATTVFGKKRFSVK